MPPLSVSGKYEPYVPDIRLANSLSERHYKRAPYGSSTCQRIGKRSSGSNRSSIRSSNARRKNVSKNSASSRNGLTRNSGLSRSAFRNNSGKSSSKTRRGGQTRVREWLARWINGRSPTGVRREGI